VRGDEAAVNAIAAAPDGSSLTEPEQAIFRFATTLDRDPAGPAVGSAL